MIALFQLPSSFSSVILIPILRSSFNASLCPTISFSSSSVYFPVHVQSVRFRIVFFYPLNLHLNSLSLSIIIFCCCAFISSHPSDSAPSLFYFLTLLTFTNYLQIFVKVGNGTTSQHDEWIHRHTNERTRTNIALFACYSACLFVLQFACLSICSAV